MPADVSTWLALGPRLPEMAASAPARAAFCADWTPAPPMALVASFSTNSPSIVSLSTSANQGQRPKIGLTGESMVLPVLLTITFIS